MYVLYEDSGNFKAEKVFSKADASMQVEAESGRRSKIKTSSVLFHFDSPAPETLLEQAQAMASDLDLDFLWECAPQEDIDAADFAQEYFGHPPSPVEKAALIFALHSAPAYFHRRGKGRYRPAPPDILKAALAAIEKRQKQAQKQQEWTDQLLAGQLPAELADVAPTFIIQPDKNTLEWKAFDAAVTQSATTPEKLLLSLKVWPHPLAMHQYKFLATHFPRGTGFPEFDLPATRRDLPMADVVAYSVDDSSTTEFDDALSATQLTSEIVQVGVHIAVPALAVVRGSALDEIARKRMSTVYVPGDKIPMLPDELVDAYSLNAGKTRPALSLYIQVSLETGQILSSETRLENIQVTENLRHKDLEDSATLEALNDPRIELPYGDWLRPLWQVSRHLARQREQMRGKPENHNRVEYLFELDGSPDDPDTPVRLVPRQRNAPLDLLIAEYMILANNIWGGYLDHHGLPGIYRSQQTGRVRMSTHPLPHETIGVPQYAWSTSPLRRYIDLINQSQIIAAAEHGVSARLVAPFKPKDADLFAIISGFDAQYALWNEHQTAMERYWCLRWLQQQNIRSVQAAVLRDELVRLTTAPFVTRVAGLPELERGQIITLDILAFDELGLELNCRLHETTSI